MRRIIPVLVLILCIALLALPVAAAAEKGGDPAGAAVASGGGPGQPQVTNGASGPAEIPAGQARETIRQETRLENQNGTSTGTAIQNRTETRLGNQAGDTAAEQAKNRTGAQTVTRVTTPSGQTVSQIRETIRMERQQMNATLQSSNQPAQQRNANQNEVYLAVHALLAMETVTGGIGPQISAIARNFNTSAQSTWQYEDRIQSRDSISRLFFGGDQDAAAELNALTVQNENRIRQIEQLMNAADLDPESRAMLEEQLQIMEQENTRLSQMSAAEQQDRGLFGWIGK